MKCLVLGSVAALMLSLPVFAQSNMNSQMDSDTGSIERSPESTTPQTTAPASDSATTIDESQQKMEDSSSLPASHTDTIEREESVDEVETSQPMRDSATPSSVDETKIEE